MSEPPGWGTPAPPGPAEGGVQDVAREIHWKHTPAGLTRPGLEAATIQRQAGVALLVNLLVLFLAVGLCSAPGALLAFRARALATVDPVRAQRSLMWSWLLLASNLLLYVLLTVVIVILVLSILSGT